MIPDGSPAVDMIDLALAAGTDPWGPEEELGSHTLEELVKVPSLI